MNNEFLKKLLQDRQTRKEATCLSHYLFFHVYFHNYVKYSTAEFQKTLLGVTEKENTREVFVIAFRGGGKSTILSHSYPIWAALGIQRKRFIIIISQTQNQAQQILSNIRRELEMNELLKKDFGPFTDRSGEWSNNALDIPKYGVKIIATSSGGSIRGIRHGSYRPDLIICDDVEDIASVKTLEGRDRTYQWFTSEVLPLGDVGTRVIVIGNMLHEDSLMMKLKEYDDKVGVNSVFLQYPLVNDDGQILWPEKYTKNDIENLRRSAMDPYTFEREYLLRIVPDEDRVVHKEWIHYYDNLPNPIEKPPRLIAIGVDLALSQKETADFTTMVPAYVTGYGKNLRIYILAHIVNKRFVHPDTLKEIKRLCDQLFHQFKLNPIVYVESVAYQASVSQQLTVEGVFSEPVYVSGLDKRSRLSITTPYIQTGRVLFPRHGAEGLISQITNFGVEKHDDLADGYSAMMLKIIDGDHRTYDPIPSDPKPDIPVYREFAGEMINMSEPLFSLDMRF